MADDSKTKARGGLARAVGTVGGLTLVSRLLGYVRDIFTASIIGAGPLGDAFTWALTLPNSFRQIFAEGAFNAAFVPTYTDIQTKDGKKQAALFAGRVMSALILILLPLTLLALWQMPFLVAVLSKGYDPEGQRFAWAVTFGRIMFGYLGFVSLMALCVGVLNANRQFAPGPMVQIGYNVVIIAALVALVPAIGYPAHVLSFGVLSAGFLQFAVVWLLASLLLGITILPRLPHLDHRLRTMLLLMGPGVASASGLQIASLLNRALASEVVGAQAQLYFAERLYFLPLAIIGIAFGVVILPTLTRALSENKQDEAQDTISQGLQLAVFIAVPAAVALAIMPREIISTLFQYGAFDSAATKASGSILLALSFGLPPVILQRILYPAFFARKDTLTPMVLTLIGVALQVALAILLFSTLGVFGLGLSIALASWSQFLLILMLVLRRGYWKAEAEVLTRTLRVCLSAAAMGIVVFLLKTLFLDGFGTGNAWPKVPFMFALVSLGGTAYILISIVMNAVPPSAIAALRRFNRRSA